MYYYSRENHTVREIQCDPRHKHPATVLKTSRGLTVCTKYRLISMSKDKFQLMQKKKYKYDKKVVLDAMLDLYLRPSIGRTYKID